MTQINQPDLGFEEAKPTSDMYCRYGGSLREVLASASAILQYDITELGWKLAICQTISLFQYFSIISYNSTNAFS